MVSSHSIQDSPFSRSKCQKLPNASKNLNPDLYTVKVLIKLALRVSELLYGRLTDSKIKKGLSQIELHL